MILVVLLNSCTCLILVDFDGALHSEFVLILLHLVERHVPTGF